MSLTNAAERNLWKVGLARRIITPQTSVWLAGYGTKRPPSGKLHDLWMKALALEDQVGNQVVLITSDFQGVPRSMSDRVFALLKSRHQLERHQVMLTFSHNHCGPRLGDDLVDYYPVEPDQVRLVEDYTDHMVTECVAMIGEALNSLSPSVIAEGRGHTTFAVNRRNNREADVPELVAQGQPLVGPVDHDVPVLTVRKATGEMRAVLFGYACHPTTLSFRKWCGDYPGFAQLNLERAHPGAMAMFVNTCGGDQNPLPRRTVQLCEKYGDMLSGAVEDVLKQELTTLKPEIRSKFESIDLEYEHVVTEQELQAYAASSNIILARWARRQLKRLQEGVTFPTTCEYPLHAWLLGDSTLMIGMGAETVVDYAIRFKREFGRTTWVCGYTDDMLAYIPSRRIWDEGGYEGGARIYEYGHPALRWANNVEDRVAGGVHRLVREFTGKVSN